MQLFICHKIKLSLPHHYAAVCMCERYMHKRYMHKMMGVYMEVSVVISNLGVK